MGWEIRPRGRQWLIVGLVLRQCSSQQDSSFSSPSSCRTDGEAGSSCTRWESQWWWELLYRDAKSSDGNDPGRREGQIIRVTP